MSEALAAVAAPETTADATTATAPVTESTEAATGIITAATTGSVPDWRAGLEGEHKEFASRLATPADAVKVALDFRKQNSSMIRVPGVDAKPEDIARFHKAIGVPEKPEDYEFDLGRDLTDADKPVMESVAKVMHANGVPKNAVKAVTKAVADLAQAQVAEQNRVAVQARDAAQTALRKEWGADYDGNLTLAQRALKVFGGADAEALLNTVVNGAKLGDHPTLVKVFGTIGRRMGEGEFIGAVSAGERQSVQERIQAIMLAHPPGTEKYKSMEVQRELAELHGKLAPPDTAGQFGGRRV